MANIHIMDLDVCDDSRLIDLFSLSPKAMRGTLVSQLTLLMLRHWLHELTVILAWRTGSSINQLSSSIQRFALTLDNSRYRPTVSILRSPTSPRTNENRHPLVIHAVMTKIIPIVTNHGILFASVTKLCSTFSKFIFASLPHKPVPD